MPLSGRGGAAPQHEQQKNPFSQPPPPPTHTHTSTKPKTFSHSSQAHRAVPPPREPRVHGPLLPLPQPKLLRGATDLSLPRRPPRGRAGVLAALAPSLRVAAPRVDPQHERERQEPEEARRGVGRVGREGAVSVPVEERGGKC